MTAPARAPGRRAGLVAAAAVAAAVVASFATLRLDVAALLSPAALRAMGDFIGEFLHPDLSAPFVRQVAFATVQTFAVSALGTVVAVAFAAVLALPASGRWGTAVALAARFVFNVQRSVPELVWAALMVLAAGLGPFAGTLALALHTTGVLGRLFAESLQNAPPGPEAALREAGAVPATAFTYGTLALVAPQWLAYALYRWEMNIRMAAVLGFVGAGGLGQMLYFHLSLFQQAQASTVLAAMFLLVAVVDAASAAVRRRLAAA